MSTHGETHHDGHYQRQTSHETCCCCIGIRSAPKVVGVLDVIFFISKLYAVIKNTSNTQSILIADIVILLFVSLPRMGTFLLWQRNPHDLKGLDLYIRARFYSFLVLIANLVIISIYVFAVASSVKSDTTDPDQ